HAGSYDVVVANANGSAVSAAATLTVLASGGVANGSFESDFAHWTTTGNQGVGFRASEGTKAVSFNWNNTVPNAVLSQAFATVVGQTYLLDFDFGVYAFNQSEQRLRVEVQGATSLFAQTLSIFGTGGG